MLDGFGLPHTICLKGFCGLYGTGSQCTTGIVSEVIVNCYKISVDANFRDQESCEICEPGYYRYVYYAISSETT